MKHNEKEILDKAKVILDDASNNYDYSIDKVIFHKVELINFGKHKGKELSTWLVIIDSTFLSQETTDFLIINDDDGEPLFLQTKHQSFEIEKVNGTYAFKD